jgi:predicted nucleotidyltransferase
MPTLTGAVKKTLAYSAYFGFPLFPHEVHRWLISSRRTPPNKVLAQKIPALSTHEINYRHQLEISAREKMSQAKKVASFLGRIPTIQLVAVTGSVAVGNVRDNDDIDILIVTSAHALWLTRLLVIFLLSVFFHRRLPRQSHRQAAGSICPNLWLETGSLKVPTNRRNLYTAHEVLYVTPVFDRSSIHENFLRENHWVSRFLANAYPAVPEKTSADNPVSFSILLFPLNLLAFIIQYIYMKPKITHEDITLHSAYFHTQNFARKISRHLSKIIRIR